MIKDKSIVKLIDQLRAELPFSLISLVDYWEADLCAIGLKRENKVVYLSTYNYLEYERLLFDFDLEIIAEDDEHNFEVVKEGRGVTFIDLLSEIKGFFEV